MQVMCCVREAEFLSAEAVALPGDLPEDSPLPMLQALYRILVHLDGERTRAAEAAADAQDDVTGTGEQEGLPVGLDDAIGECIRADWNLYQRRLAHVRPLRCHVIEDARRMLASMDRHPGARVHAFVVRRPWMDDAASSGVVSLDTDVRYDPGLPTVWLGSGAVPAWIQGLGLLRRSASAARRYWSLDAFNRHAGRSVTYVPSMQHLAYAVRILARQGTEQVFLKAARLKAGTWLADIPDSARTLQGAWEVVSDTLGLHFLRMPDAGEERGFLIQEVLPMRNETRFFVVRNRIVQGVPVHRPAISGQRYPDGGRYKRVAGVSCPTPNSAETVPDRQGAARRARLARRFVAEARAENALLHTYVLDIADTDKGPVVIELNPVSNAGLYALDPAVLARAMVADAASGADRKLGPAPKGGMWTDGAAMTFTVTVDTAPKAPPAGPNPGGAPVDAAREDGQDALRG